MLRDNGFTGGPGRIEIEGEVVECEFAGKDANGTKVCIQRKDEELSIVRYSPNVGNRKYSIW